jgi:hypothetical protein
MFSSAGEKAQQFTDEFITALTHLDVPGLKHTGLRAALYVGEVVLLRFAGHALERVVSTYSFPWNWLTVWYVA